MMAHPFLAFLWYTALVVQIRFGLLSGNGLTFDAFAIAATVPFLVTRGNSALLWVALCGLGSGLASFYPLGIGLVVFVVGAMAVAPVFGERRGTIERGLALAAFVAGTTFVSHLGRRLAYGVPIELPAVIAVTGFTLVAWTVLAALVITARHLVCRRLAARY